MKQKALRILLLSDAGSFHTQRFFTELKRQGCRVMLASLEEGPMRYVRLKPVGPVKSFHYLLAVPQVRSMIKRFRPDVINAHYACGYGFIAAKAAGDAAVPIALNLWGSDVLIVPNRSTQGRMKTKAALERADYIFGDSEYLIESARKVGRLKAATVIPWGIEREYLKFHRSNYAFDRPLSIIVPRRHEEIYNNEFIVKALEPLMKAGEVRTTFPAFGSTFEEFRKLTSGLPESGLRFYDTLPRGEFLEFMAEHDVYLSASRSDSSPASLIEAMALGLVPVAADIEGVREWLTAESGFVFEQDNADGLRGVIERLVRGDNSYEDMRRRNLESVRQRAIFEENVAKQIEIMTELARGTRQ